MCGTTEMNHGVTTWIAVVVKALRHQVGYVDITQPAPDAVKDRA